jgi:beta-glucanase (GH16 family)
MVVFKRKNLRHIRSHHKMSVALFSPFVTWTRRSALLIACCCLLLPQVFAQGTTGWTLVWAEEFNQADGSSPDATKWNYDTGGGGWGNSELETYTTTNSRIQGGNLVIEAHQIISAGTTNYTSARLKTQGKWSWKYGRMEARIKIPRGQGIWPAFWMLGTNIPSAGWPTCGEIDIMENIGREPTQVHGTAHGPGYSGGNGIGGPCALPGNPTFADAFHIYAVEWTTNQIKWFVDGNQYFSVNTARIPAGTQWVFTQPQFIILNVAVGGGWPGYPDGTSAFPQQMLVDYVRVYAPSNLVACGANLLSNPGFETATLASWTTFGNTIGNTSIQNITNRPVYNGTNVFKVYGQFNGSINQSGIYQDIPAGAGQGFNASGWMLTPSDDQIAGTNTAWMEISFRDAATNVLSLYRSAYVTANTPPGLWLGFAVTNQYNPANFALIGAVTNLIAPANTSFARCRLVFQQPAQAAGAVLFDDLKLSVSGTTPISVPVSASRVGSNLNLAFATYLDLPYQVNWTTSLTTPNWSVLTNIPGNGGNQTATVNLQASTRFYRVTRLCN